MTLVKRSLAAMHATSRTLVATPKLLARLLGWNGAIHAHQIAIGKRPIPAGLSSEISWDQDRQCLIFRGWPLKVHAAGTTYLTPMTGWTVHFPWSYGNMSTLSRDGSIEIGISSEEHGDLFDHRGEQIERPNLLGFDEFIDLYDAETNIRLFLREIEQELIPTQEDLEFDLMVAQFIEEARKRAEAGIIPPGATGVARRGK